MWPILLSSTYMYTRFWHVDLCLSWMTKEPRGCTLSWNGLFGSRKRRATGFRALLARTWILRWKYLLSHVFICSTIIDTSVDLHLLPALSDCDSEYGPVILACYYSDCNILSRPWYLMLTCSHQSSRSMSKLARLWSVRMLEYRHHTFIWGVISHLQKCR